MTTTSFKKSFHYNLWGIVLGLGFIRDVGQWISFFAEYDFYDYGNRRLNTLTNVIAFPTPPLQMGLYPKWR